MNLSTQMTKRAQRRRARWFALPIAAGAGSLLLWALFQSTVRPWYLRWGATDADVQAVLPGDDLVPHPIKVVNRAITIHAPACAIWPWIVQMGADRGGLYSYTWLERLIGCPQINADSIHPEWQHVRPGDLVKLCPGDPAPPPYIVAAVEPNRALVLGHHVDLAEPSSPWADSWQFVLQPVDETTTRLILRTRIYQQPMINQYIEPGVFVMERGMLLGIKERAERAAAMEERR